MINNSNSSNSKGKGKNSNNMMEVETHLWSNDGSQNNQGSNNNHSKNYDSNRNNNLREACRVRGGSRPQNSITNRLTGILKTTGRNGSIGFTSCGYFIHISEILNQYTNTLDSIKGCEITFPPFVKESDQNQTKWAVRGLDRISYQNPGKSAV